MGGGIRKISKQKQSLMLVLMYAFMLAALIFLLKYFEYRYFIRDFSMEAYVGVVAVLFTAIGVWIGLKIFKKGKSEIQSTDFKVDEKLIQALTITKREYEVLDLIAKGFSNKEIAEKLFISLPTVKTHSSNLFLKLDVQRRTQAVKKARELKIIP